MDAMVPDRELIPDENIEADTRLRISPGVEVFVGLQERPMAYVPTARRYVSLSPVSAEVLLRLQQKGCERAASTKAALICMLGGEPQDHTIPPKALPELLNQLERTGILSRPSHARALNGVSGRGLVRLPIWRPNRNLMPPAVERRCREWAGMIGYLAVATVMVSLVVTVATLFPGHHRPDTGRVLWGAVALLVVTHVLLHEAAHGFAAGYHGIPVREFGIALLYWFIPVAYTDRTDCYRLRNFRSLAGIAAAGPVFDVCAIGATATSVLLGWTDATGHTLLKCQIAIGLANLNPLLPGDGYRISEALLGTRDIRRTAFALLTHQVFRSGDPGRFAPLNGRQRLGCLIYAVASVLYLAFLLAVSTAAAAILSRTYQ